MSQESMDLSERVSALESRVEELEEVLEEGGSSIGSDIGDFVESCSPSTHKERATAIAYYLDQERDQDLFTSDDIVDGYVECRLSLPANPSDVLANTEERGWVMRRDSSGNRQRWTITREGMNAVEEGFES